MVDETMPNVTNFSILQLLALLRRLLSSTNSCKMESGGLNTKLTALLLSRTQMKLNDYRHETKRNTRKIVFQ